MPRRRESARHRPTPARGTAAVLALVAVAAAAPGMAQTAGPDLGDLIGGPGADRCASFVIAAEAERLRGNEGTARSEYGVTPRYAAYTGWMLGFVSGLNSFNGGLGRPGSPRVRLIALERRCRERPGDSVAAALLQVIEGEGRRRP